MGNVISARLLFIGLDNSGKTSLLTFLEQGANDVVPKPTTAFDTKDVKYRGVNFTIYDVAGGQKVRDLWKHYYSEMDAVVWIVDASDAERFGESKAALQTALKDASMKRDCPLLVVANKADAAGSKSDDEIKAALDLDNLLKGRTWTIRRTNAKKGDGVYEGFKWLGVEIKTTYKKNKKAGIAKS